MKTAARRLLTVDLREERVGGFAPLGAGRSRVDREKGIIRGVKVVGRKSPNRHGVPGAQGTDYTTEALEGELRLIEGICVNVDHPPRERPGKERSARDRFAWISEARVTPDGIFGNLCFLDPTDPLAVKMMNAAEKKPEAFALSHNATGRGEVKNGRYVIHEIVEVRSVDIVADGGTNRSLFEGRQVATTLRTLIQESRCDAAGKEKLLEMGEEYAAPMMDAEAPAAPAEGGDDAWKQHLVNAIAELVKKDDPACHKLGQKIMKLLKPGASDEGGGGKEKETEAEEGDESAEESGGKGKEKGGDDEKKDKGAMESLQRDFAALKTKDAVRDLCESLDFRPSAVQLKALLSLDDEADRKALIQESRAAAARRGGAPRSMGQAPAGEGGKGGGKSLTLADVGKAVRGGR